MGTLYTKRLRGLLSVTVAELLRGQLSATSLMQTAGEKSRVSNETRRRRREENDNKKSRGKSKAGDGRKENRKHMNENITCPRRECVCPDRPPA